MMQASSGGISYHSHWDGWFEISAEVVIMIIVDFGVY